MNFTSQIFFNDINHGYRAGILKKNSLWLLPLYIVVATYFFYEKVRRTMCTATESNLKNIILLLNRGLILYSKSAITMRHVSIESTLLLIFLI